MKKEWKTVVLLMLGGIVFMVIMDGMEHYLAAKWYPHMFLLTVKDMLYTIEWVVIGSVLGLLAQGGRLRGFRVSKAYLIGALASFLIGASSKRIYGIIPRGVMDWFHAHEIAFRIHENWFFAVAGLLLFMGLSGGRERDGKGEKKMNLMVCGIFLLLLFPLDQLGYIMLQIPEDIGQQLYIVLYFVRFLLFGMVVSLTARPDGIEIPAKAASVKVGALCLALSLGWFFLTGWRLVFYHPEILWSGAYCASLLLAAYSGLFLTKGRFRWKVEGGKLKVEEPFG